MAKAAAESEFLLLKECLAAERVNKEAEKAAELALMEKQAALIREDKEKEFNLWARAAESDAALQHRELEIAKLQQQLEL